MFLKRTPTSRKIKTTKTCFFNPIGTSQTSPIQSSLTKPLHSESIPYWIRTNTSDLVVSVLSVTLRYSTHNGMITAPSGQPHLSLSYPVNSGITSVEVELEGIEPSTSSLQNLRSRQLELQPHNSRHWITLSS